MPGIQDPVKNYKYSVLYLPRLISHSLFTRKGRLQYIFYFMLMILLLQAPIQ
jgi:hypothetical protein